MPKRKPKPPAPEQAADGALIGSRMLALLEAGGHTYSYGLLVLDARTEGEFLKRARRAWRFHHPEQRRRRGRPSEDFVLKAALDHVADALMAAPASKPLTRYALRKRVDAWLRAHGTPIASRTIDRFLKPYFGDKARLSPEDEDFPRLFLPKN
jgi:hypothetical protein